MKLNEAKSLNLDRKACYAALSSKDSRFDGKFFVGVSSTGVYCRPICNVKLPKEENCSFFISAAAAEAEGYRPCLKCRPELAPGMAPIDSSVQTARKAAMFIEEDSLSDSKIADIAKVLGITDRHLRRIFANEFGVSPIQYLQTRRLLLAKNLLTDTKLSVTDIAMLSGFGSVRRFNELFKAHYKFSPSRLRKMDMGGTEKSKEITLLLGYRPPYDWGKMISFLEARAIPGIECIKKDVYYRTVVIQKGEKVFRGWVSVTNVPKKNSVSVTLSMSLLPLLSQVLTRVKALFDINCNPAEIYEKLKVMDTLSPDICVKGMRLPGCFDAFEMSVRAVLGQQISVKAARTLAMRVASSIGEKIETPFEELNYTFPTPEVIFKLEKPIEDRLGPLGITGARARSIFALAEAMVKGDVSFLRTADVEEQMRKLLELPGFGPWTVQYIGMRAFSWPDAFLHTDYGVKKALQGMKPDEILKLSEAWRPWRSYATLNLWNSLSE